MTEIEQYPLISVIVPIRNEERFIAVTLNYLLAQDYPVDRLEILVVDGQSDDRTVEIVSEMAERDRRIHLLTNPKRLSSSARNIGARAAEGEIITFVDGHTYIDNDQLLKNLVALMREQNVAVLSRPQFLETPENTWFQRAVAVARKSAIGHGLDSTIYTAEDREVDPTSSGATYKNEVFDRVGYFDERFDACEDVEFNYRVAQSGYGSYTSLKTAVYYYPRNSLGGLFRQLMRYGIGRFRLARKHPGTLSLGTLIPFLFTIGIPALIIASLLYAPLWYVLTAGVGGYAAFILLGSLIVSLRQGISYLPILPLIYPVIHFGLGWGFLIELCRTLIGKGVSFTPAE